MSLSENLPENLRTNLIGTVHQKKNVKSPSLDGQEKILFKSTHRCFKFSVSSLKTLYTVVFMVEFLVIRKKQLITEKQLFSPV